MCLAGLKGLFKKDGTECRNCCGISLLTNAGKAFLNNYSGHYKAGSKSSNISSDHALPLRVGHAVEEIFLLWFEGGSIYQGGGFFSDNFAVRLSKDRIGDPRILLGIAGTRPVVVKNTHTHSVDIIDRSRIYPRAPTESVESKSINNIKSNRHSRRYRRLRHGIDSFRLEYQ